MNAPTRLFAATPLLFLAAVAHAQPVSVKIQPTQLKEGRPTRVRVSFKNTGQRALLLVELGARVIQPGLQASEILDWTTRVKGRRLDPIEPEVVTLSFSAHDDPGPQARAPKLPIRAGLEGEPFRKLQVLLPGRRTSISLDFVPRAASCTLSATWKAIPYRAGMPLYSIHNVERWSAPGKKTQPNEWGAKTQLVVELTRWRRWSGNATGEVLVSESELAKLGIYEAEERPRLHVQPAPFGRRAARALAQASDVKKAVRLQDGRWVLQSKSRWWLVAAKGTPLSQPGSLYRAARDLASLGLFGFDWFGVKSEPKLAAALRAQKLGTPTKGGLGLSIEVSSKTLVPFLELLAKHGMKITAQGIRSAK
jgi:hypothetical protein